MATPTAINMDALKSEIRLALINEKANACPIAIRIAWHASGTWDASDKSGGSNGATMRFEPESSDPANAGLSIVRDLLLPVHKRHPSVSLADLWGAAACAAVEFLGGPKVPFCFGRTDDADASRCPANGRLPDASQGAEHLRAVFGRMGFSDKDIVALSGAHTLGRCHVVRSGFDGPWTTNPLRFDNQYFVNLVNRTWRVRNWDGNLQYEDEESGELMMLPTDIALIKDPQFRVHVERYARDQEAFFADFADVYARLLSNGCPESCNPANAQKKATDVEQASADFREFAMHGSVAAAKRAVGRGARVHDVEATSGRTALHKAAFWGHIDMVRYLTEECKLDLNVRDTYGDTALHDASKFGHAEVTRMLVAAGADTGIKNLAGRTARDIAVEHSKPEVVAVLDKAASKL